MAEQKDRSDQLVEQEIHHAKHLSELRQQTAPLEAQCGDPTHPTDCGTAGTTDEAEAEARPS